jgi:acetyl-CoA C-acetyltransferase
MAKKWNISRVEMEKFALESHQRARRAQKEGRFDRELIETAGLKQDETVRDTSLEQMAQLEPLAPGGTITAAVASQTGDAAAAMLVVSEKALKRYNLKPRARVHHMSVYSDDPIYMLTAPIPATKQAMKKSGMKLADIDLVEINEAFAPVPMAWLKENGYPHDRTNVNGGAIALAHPLGATGVKLMTTLLHELERQKKRWGLQTMCEGGGVANVTIIERLG